LRSGPSNSISRLWQFFSSAAACFVLLLILLYTSPLVPRLAEWLTGRWEQPKGDILIVLGGDQLSDGTIGIASYWRSVYAVRAFRTGGFKRIVVTGGLVGPHSPMSVARAMADFMAGLGVPRDAITIEEHSRSTRENALFTARMIAGWPGTKVLLSSDIHMRRAHATFAHAGVDTIPAPIPDIGKRWNNWAARWDCIWEVGVGFVKYGYYAMRGWI
jgi:uncharacterized SAM-binding protein YcdF (DUF218 family)